MVVAAPEVISMRPRFHGNEKGPEKPLEIHTARVSVGSFECAAALSGGVSSRYLHSKGICLGPLAPPYCSLADGSGVAVARAGS